MTGRDPAENEAAAAFRAATRAAAGRSWPASPLLLPALRLPPLDPAAGVDWIPENWRLPLLAFAPSDMVAGWPTDPAPLRAIAESETLRLHLANAGLAYLQLALGETLDRNAWPLHLWGENPRPAPSDLARAVRRMEKGLKDMAAAAAVLRNAAMRPGADPAHIAAVEDLAAMIDARILAGLHVTAEPVEGVAAADLLSSRLSRALHRLAADELEARARAIPPAGDGRPAAHLEAPRAALVERLAGIWQAAGGAVALTPDYAAPSPFHLFAACTCGWLAALAEASPALEPEPVGTGGAADPAALAKAANMGADRATWAGLTCAPGLDLLAPLIR